MLQTFKQWFIYYVHDETFLGKALNAFVEQIRLILVTILDSSDGSWSGDLFMTCCLLLVHLVIPMIVIFLYYGFRLRQIKKGQITDPGYQIKVRKYFAQASVILLLNVILALSYIELSDITGLFMPSSPSPAKPEISEPKQPIQVPPRKEFAHVYFPEFNLLFSYLTRHQFPVSCLSKSDSKSLFFTAKPEKSVVLHLNPFSPDNFDNIPEQTVYLEIFADPLGDNEIPQLQTQFADCYHLEKNLKIDEVLSFTGFSKDDADKLRPICRFRYLPKISPVKRPEQIRIPASPGDDTIVEPDYAFEKAEMMVFNIKGGWIAFAINIKMANTRQFYDESGELSTPDSKTGKPAASSPRSIDSEFIDQQAADMDCISPPPLKPDDLRCENYPIITKIRFCTQGELFNLKSTVK